MDGCTTMEYLYSIQYSNIKKHEVIRETEKFIVIRSGIAHEQKVSKSSMTNDSVHYYLPTPSLDERYRLKKVRESFTAKLEKFLHGNVDSEFQEKFLAFCEKEGK